MCVCVCVVADLVCVEDGVMGDEVEDGEMDEGGEQLD